MPMFQNTYRKLDMDTAVNKYDNQSYLDCRNFRITSLEGSKSGALSVIKGNSYVGEFPDLSHFIGGKKVRNTMIMFTAYEPTADPGIKLHNGCIWTINPSATDPLSTLSYVYRGELGMDTANPVTDVVTFYESDKVIKVYWTDRKNNLRYCNIADPLLSTFTPEQFEIVQEMSLSQPVLTEITAGVIPVGMVQYAYRLYKNNGHASNFSVAGQLIPITDKSESLIDSLQYGGSDGLNESGDPKSSGKGIVIKIENLPSNYDRIEVVAIHYKTINGPTDISIVGVYPITETVIVTDVGIYQSGKYSLEEFSLINNPFVCETLDTKNNILFVSNIKESEYDIDYDARAYRWNNVAGLRTCQLYEKDGSYWHNDTYNSSLWSKRTSGGSVISWIGSILSLPKDIDAIIRNNIAYNKTQTAATVYKFQQDGSTLGGQGGNIKYNFAINNTVTIDAQYAYTFSDGLDYERSKKFFNVKQVVPGYYSGVDSPRTNQASKTWVRDEIYRFGIVFFDGKGRPSPVKWIADIRMPDYMQQYSGMYYQHRSFLSGTATYSAPIKVVFNVTNAPSSAKYCQIVYVPRENKDKTSLMQGRIGWWNLLSGAYQARESVACYVANYNAHSGDKKFLYFISPEASFYKKYDQGNEDYLEVIGTNKHVGDVRSVTGSLITKTLKFWGFTPVSDNNKWSSISSASILPASTEYNIVADTKSFEEYSYKQLMYTVSGSTYYTGDLGTCMLLKIPSNLNTTGLLSEGYMFANIRRNLFGVQYGGNSYEDRTRNTYIPAGPVISISAGVANPEASWGDAWINYHSQLSSYWNSAYSRRFQSIEALPVETSINLTYRHDDSPHKLSGNASYYIREGSNAEFTIGSTTYSPGWSDLYLFNTVYSRHSDNIKFYPAPLDYDAESNHDTLVKASDVKLGREAIDPWTSFNFGESISLDNSYGPVKKLVSWKNNLFALQEDAVAVLSVLDRSLIQDNNQGSLSLGEGGILSRYDYLSTSMGLSTINSTVTTETGLYWYDNKRRRFNRFRNGVEDLSSVKGVNFYLNNIPKECGEEDNVSLVDYTTTPHTKGKGFMMSYNPVYHEIWFSIKDAYNKGDTLIYNEILDDFVGFMDTLVTGQIPFDNKLISSLYDKLYFENEGTHGRYYGSYYDSYVTMIINPMPNIPVTFTNYEITSEVWDGDTQVHDKTISSIRTENDYQDTGVLYLDNSNSRRLLRTWRLDAKRNSADRARLRDTYAKVTMTFENDNSNYNLVLHDLVTLYMVPAESVASKFSQQK